MLAFSKIYLSAPVVASGSFRLNPNRQLLLSLVRLQSSSATPATTTVKEPSFVALRSDYTAPTGLTPNIESPQRDLVNFPRLLKHTYPAQTRVFNFFPESWFDFLYTKTGVTGPYFLGFGLATFLLSKEFYIIEHEFNNVLPFFVIGYLVRRYFTPWHDKMTEDNNTETHRRMCVWQEDSMQYLEDEKVVLDNRLWAAEQSAKDIEQVKKENVLMQMEAEYRQRMMTAYSEVKRRLDYFKTKQNTIRQHERQHMTKWIVENVKKGITEQQERDNLKSCLDALKKLSPA